MALLWSERYRMGHEGMDRDHVQLMALINQFGRLAQEGELGQAMPVLDQIVTFCHEHEAREEALLARTDCPARRHLEDEHQNAHAQLTFRATKLRHRPSQAMMDSVAAYLERWFDEHVVNGDMPYRSWMVSAAPAPAPRALARTAGRPDFSVSLPPRALAA